MGIVNFSTSKEDDILISSIVKRVHKLHPDTFNHMDLMMDITACHCNGNELDLEKLLSADDFNFNHDIFGISRHISRTTGKLLYCFVPRCSK